MADLKTTNIYGDAYINNKVGIATNAPATRLQIGQLSPTAATEGIQFGDDTGARIYRDSAGIIKVAGGFTSTNYILAGNYLQTAGNLIYPASQTATQRLEVGNASGNAWVTGIAIAQGGNVTVYNNLTVNNAATVTNDLTVNGNTYLGNANNDTVYVNDTIRIGATDSGDASLFFGEGAVAGSDYGARWYWDSGYTFTWYTRNNGTDTALFDYVTNDTSYLNWRRHFHMQNKSIDYNAQIHFNAGTRFVGNNTSYLIFRSDSTGAGGIQVQDGGIAIKGYTGYWDSAGGGILNDTGNWAVRYNFGNANSGGTLYGAWVVNGNISATNLSGTNTGDQTVGNGTITIAAGTGVGVGTTNTFTTNQSGATTVTISNSGVTSNVAGTGISVSGATGAVTITNSGVTSLAGTTNRITVSGATGGVTLNLPQDIHTGASPTFAGLSLTSVSTTGATITNLTGAYQNTTVYDSPRTQSATPSRGIRAPASSIQFTDSYAIAPFYTYRSTGDWPVPYGIGWGTGGESSGIFQRYASNGSSFGDMIFYTGNDGSGAFSFRRHTWEGNAYFAAGSGELNTELFRIDWAGKATATSFALPGGFTITDPGSGYAAFSNWVLLGTTGFYSSTNSAHLHPNTGTYGSWKITGTRGGWYGIEFESGVSLMANSNEVGFHRNGHGWQFWWSAGTGYVHKGNPGGGTQATILDSVNYPTQVNGVLLRTASTPAYGDWDSFGNITQTTNVITQEYFNVGIGSSTPNSNFPSVVSYRYGILTNLGSGADARAQIYISHAGNDLIFRGGWGTASWQTWNRCLTNINSPYAYNMNQYVRTTDTCSFAALTVSGVVDATQFRDSADTAYFVDPAGTSNLSKLSTFTMAHNDMNPMHIQSPYSARYNGSAQYRNGTMGHGTVDCNVMFSNWGSGFIDSWGSPANAPGGSGHYVGLQGFHYNHQNSVNAYGFQMLCAGEADNRFFWRSAWPNLRSWVEMIHSGNIGSQTVASCTGNAATATTATSAGCINSDTGNVGGNRLQYWQVSGNTTLNPDGEWYNAIRMGHGDPVTYYGNTLAIRMTGGNLGDIYTRTLTNGTQGSWNRFWHNNNDGAGSGLDADLVDGKGLAIAGTADTIVLRDASGHITGQYILGSYFNASAGNSENPTIGQIWTQNTTDNYLRKSTPAHFRSQVTDGSYPSLTGANASGTWSINITGNAGTATSATTATALSSMNISQFTNNSGYLTSVTNISGNAATATLATKASTLSQGGGTGTGMTFNWSGQGGQPTWLWGSNDGTNIYVWNPSNFNVNYATSAGSATSATNATTAGGLAVQSGTNYDANKIVRTDGNGYILAGWINTISGDNGTTAIDRVYASNDGYIRYYTPANFRTVLDVPTRNGSGVTNFGINTAPSNRLHINGDGSNPTIRIDNTAFGSGTSSSRGFFGWLPISINGNTRYIQLYS